MPQNARPLSAVFGSNTLQMWSVCSNGKCVSIPQSLCISGVVFNPYRVFFIFLQSSYCTISIDLDVMHHTHFFLILDFIYFLFFLFSYFSSKFILYYFD